MEHYRFFNDTPEDPREYLASEFAEYFARFLSDGLYTHNGQLGLRTTPGTGLTVNIEPGYGYIRGYMYHNDAILPKALAAASTNYDRIDRIVLRFDEVSKSIKVQVKQGTPSSTPAIPALTDTPTVKELGLYQVRVRKNAVAIVAADLLDERLTPVCGMVSSLITVPVEEMWAVWNGTQAQIMAAWEGWFGSVQNTLGVRVMIEETEPPELEAGDLWLRIV